jgi:hypothetical protein
MVKRSPLKEWRREEVISWVESELRRARFDQDWQKSPIGHDPQALEVWLAKERDKKSWKEIGDRYYRTRGSKPETRRLRARRAHGRVHRYLEDPNAVEFQEHRLRQVITEQFGVSIDAFRAFILKGHLPRKAQDRAGE